MAQPAAEGTTNLAIEAPAALIAEIEEESRKFGLQPSSYLLLLHCVHTGSVNPSFRAAVKEVFTHDREILRTLAK
jgi:hypothetical protein